MDFHGHEHRRGLRARFVPAQPHRLVRRLLMPAIRRKNFMPTKRGFAALSSEKRRSIASKGGRSVSRNRRGISSGTPLRGTSTRSVSSLLSRKAAPKPASPGSRTVSGRKVVSKSSTVVRGRKAPAASRRGFAAMSPQKRRAIASKGGRARKSA